VAGARSERFGTFTPVVLSAFQPWLFGALAAFHGLCGLAWQRTRLGAGPARRAASALVLGVALLGATALSVDGFAPGVRDAFAWLGKSEEFQAGVSESLSLLRFGGLREPSLRPALEILSGLFLAIPALAALLVWLARARRERARAILVSGWCLAWAAAALLQTRFASTLAVALALLSGASFAAALARLGAGEPRRRWPAPALLAGLALLLAPIYPGWQRSLDTLWRWSRGGSPDLGGLTRTMALAAETADWLAAHSPPTTGFDDAGGRPEYGVLSGVNFGHLLLWRSRRPMLVGNFGDDLGERNWRLALAFPSLAEDEAWGVLAERSVRYVIVGGGGPPAPGERPTLVSIMRSEPPRRGAGHARTGLRRHRLVYESAPVSPQPGAPARFRVFERVAGARIEGSAPPGARVEASLELRSRSGGRVHRAWTLADAAGRWRLTVPYSTDGGPGAVRSERHYELRCGGASHALRVPEQAVLLGATLAGPDCGAGPEPSELARRREPASPQRDPSGAGTGAT
jgi:hypothetical protein